MVDEVELHAIDISTWNRRDLNYWSVKFFYQHIKKVY